MTGMRRRAAAAADQAAPSLHSPSRTGNSLVGNPVPGCYAVTLGAEDIFNSSQFLIRENQAQWLVNGIDVCQSSLELMKTRPAEWWRFARRGRATPRIGVRLYRYLSRNFWPRARTAAKFLSFTPEENAR